MKSSTCKIKVEKGPSNAQEEMPTSIDLNRDSATVSSVQNLFMCLSIAFSYPGLQIYKEMRSALPSISEAFMIYDLPFPELTAREELQSEYIRLFVNNCQETPLVPYASLYLESESGLMGSISSRIRKIILEQGYQMETSGYEPEDHIATILELCSRVFPKLADPHIELETRLRNRNNLLWLITECLLPALDAMQQNGREHAELEFYPKFIELARVFLLDIKALFNIVPEGSGNQRSK